MKTAIGYKLFRVSKKYPGKLFPLYVNAIRIFQLENGLVQNQEKD